MTERSKKQSIIIYLDPTAHPMKTKKRFSGDIWDTFLSIYYVSLGMYFLVFRGIKAGFLRLLDVFISTNVKGFRLLMTVSNDEKAFQACPDSTCASEHTAQKAWTLFVLDFFSRIVYVRG